MYCNKIKYFNKKYAKYVSIVLIHTIILMNTFSITNEQINLIHVVTSTYFFKLKKLMIIIIHTFKTFFTEF